ncbi:MAG: hypothetical protein Q4B70_13080 [Lachnospiraceae bacterium]|nr:hypothetical protein [Lachnospiraceae bacterium]
MDEKRTGNCYFLEGLEEEERLLLIKKIKYWMKEGGLPKEVRKPISLIYNDEDRCVGYSYEELEFPGISLKELFQRENMEKYHVDSHFLFRAAKRILSVMMELSSKKIYPGLMTLESIQIHTDRADKAVLFTQPEHFQAGEMVSTYPWYPSDSKLYEVEPELFDAHSQKKADGKLMYKILTAFPKGNAKIPPDPKKQELSYVFWNILSREWKDFFLSLSESEAEYENIMKLLQESIEEENYYTDPADRKMTEEVRPFSIKKELPKAYAAIAVLREAGKSAHDISRQMYLVLEDLEEDGTYDYEEAFILGDRHPFARPFRRHEPGFRAQLAHKISAYSFGEVLLISSELLSQALLLEKRPSILYILLDGEILNDAMYQKSLEKLMELKEKYGTKIILCPAGEHRGEGYQRLLGIVDEER